MSLTYDPASLERFVVFRVSGDLDLDTQDGFEEEVLDRLHRSSVVVDMSGLEFLAIASLRSLVVCHRSAGEHHRALVYADAPRQARRLLHLSRLDEVFDLRSSVPEPRDASASPTRAR